MYIMSGKSRAFFQTYKKKFKNNSCQILEKTTAIRI